VSAPKDVSPEYVAAGGDAMTPEQAQRHFGERWRELQENIRILPLNEKFILVAEFIEAGEKVSREMTLALARHAMAELERGA
jgi:hypothetical protein